MGAGGITHVLTLTDDRSPPRGAAEFSTRGYLHIHFEDLPSQDILTDLPRAVEFIHSARLSGGSVLVHCHHGVSRSGSIILAYLLVHLSCSVYQAVRIDLFRFCPETFPSLPLFFHDVSQPWVV